mgnify:FL=1|jgi:hypothetical protein
MPPERYAPPERVGVDAATLARARAFAAAPRPQGDHQQPDRGEVLAEIPRRDGSTLLVSWRVYEGRPFVSIAPWRDGWPVKGKGCSVRLGELNAVLDALVKAAERAGGTP